MPLNNDRLKATVFPGEHIAVGTTVMLVDEQAVLPACFIATPPGQPRQSVRIFLAWLSRQG